MTGLDAHLPGIAAGDAGAFAAWLAGAEPRVRASLASFATRLDTESLLQETLLRVWQVAPGFQPDGKPDALVRFAIRVGRNLALSELRRARVDPVEAQALAALTPPDAPPTPDPLLRELIARCRQALPARLALVLRLRVEDRGGRSDHELAAEAHMKPNTFLQNVRRARLSLADCLGRKGVEITWGRA